VGGIGVEAEAFVDGYDGAKADKPEEGGEDRIPAQEVGEGEGEGEGCCGNETDDDAFDAEAAGEEHARFVAVADGPADEIRVEPAAEGDVSDLEGEIEGGGVGGVLEGVKVVGAVFVGKIQFSWRGVGDVVA
jgi:hypothetical protein